MIQTTHIVPLRTGWDPDRAAPSWYPEDLPDDWRLGYFSNAFRAVLVPAAQWTAAGSAVAGHWAEDTPPRFRFYLEREWTPDGSSKDMEPFARALRGRFGGLVTSASSFPGEGAHLPPRQVIPLPKLPSDSPSRAWEVPGFAISDPRATRSWIEDRVREAPPGPLLALLGDCRFADLERWQILIEIMSR
jgi:hypothetical protein